MEKGTRPDLAYVVHQCAQFASNLKQSHAVAVERVGFYLFGTKEKGMIVNLQASAEQFECWADATFSGEWNKEYAQDDPTTAKSRTGYVLMFAGVPLTWALKLQMEISLYTVELEYISLSQALREVISMMQLAKEAKEAKDQGVPIFCARTTMVKCKAFEDNTGALKLANVPKIWPQNKHINIKYHHFRHHVESGNITVQHVNNHSQVADNFTKPFAAELFTKYPRMLLGC